MTDDPAIDEAPCFSPDGQRIAFVRAQSKTANGSKGGPQVSPDGKRIVYFEKRDQNLDLFLFGRESNRTQRLTATSSVEAFPVFSPDGNEIFFTSNRDGGYQIYAMNLRTPILKLDLIEILRRLLEPQKTAAQ